MPNEKNPGFVVTDRRKFTFDGDVRPDAEPSTESEQEAPTITVPPAAPQASAPEPPEPEPQQPAAKKAPASEPAPAMPATGYDSHAARGAFGGQEIEFIHLLDLLVQTAMMYAGAMESGPERRVDIVGLRQMIDMISVLEEKTKGNLTEQEHTMLSNTLFQLRMTYMEIINMIDRQATQGGPGPQNGK